MIITTQGTRLKVADAHTHFAGDASRFDPTLATIFRNLQPRQPFDQSRVGRDPAELVDYMDSAGIDVLCVLAEEGPPTHYSVDSTFVLGFAAQEPERIVPIGNVNHRIETNVRRRVRSLIRGGVRGFKQYYADHHQNPYDRALMPLYEVCAEHHLPVMFHCGLHSRYYMTNPAYGEPKLFEKLFDQFPEVPFVMCHGGKGGRHQQCIEILRDHSNTYIEISDITPRALEEMCTEDLAERFIFGTDMPQFADYAALIKVVLDLPLSVEAKRKILFDNAARVFQLGVKKGTWMPAVHAA
jgi:predicted TIM-barrel fold metal-dependent hydrolase